MSENITIITVTDPDAPATKEPQIIGASSAERITAYKETERRIRETYAVAGDLVNEQTRIISDALNALYGMYDNRTDAVAGVVHSFNEPVLIKHMNNRDKASGRPGKPSPRTATRSPHGCSLSAWRSSGAAMSTSS